MELNTTAQRAVIGCAMLDTKCAAQVMTMLDETDFTDAALGECFAAMHEIWQRSGLIDPVTVAQLPQKALIIECAETVPSLSGCSVYIAKVKEQAMQQRAAVIGMNIAMGNMTTEEMLDSVTQLAGILNNSIPQKSVDMHTACNLFLKGQLEKDKRYFKTGFSMLDYYTYFSPGDFVVIGGRPSAGKTAFSLQMAMNFAKSGYRVAYMSCETKPEKLMNRMVASLGRISFDSIKRCEVDTTDKKILHLLNIMEQFPFSMVPASGMTVPEMRAEATRLKADVVVIDYLGLVRGKGKDRYETITNISLGLHEMAQSTGMLVIALSQLNRGSAEGIPKLEDLRESGQIEQDADAVLLLYKPDPDDDAPDDAVDIIVAKNKDGAVGTVKMCFDGSIQHFSAMEYGKTAAVPAAKPQPEYHQQRF